MLTCATSLMHGSLDPSLQSSCKLASLSDRWRCVPACDLVAQPAQQTTCLNAVFELVLLAVSRLASPGRVLSFGSLLPLAGCAVVGGVSQGSHEHDRSFSSGAVRFLFVQRWCEFHCSVPFYGTTRKWGPADGWKANFIPICWCCFPFPLDCCLYMGAISESAVLRSRDAPSAG